MYDQHHILYMYSRCFFQALGEHTDIGVELSVVLLKIVIEQLKERRQ